ASRRARLRWRRSLGAGAGNRAACPWRKKNPAARSLACGVSSETPRLLERAPALRGRARSLLRCPHFKCHIECDDCLLDPRLIDPVFSAMGRPAIGEGVAITSKTKIPRKSARALVEWNTWKDRKTRQRAS